MNHPPEEPPLTATNPVYTTKYEVIVIGAGHAGCEAALAAARMGVSTLVITMSKDKIAQMSCNPAIGGLAKGHLVKEIDALGGEMGRAADATGIQFRRLNASKGPAARGTRCQSEMEQYHYYMRRALEAEANMTVLEAEVAGLLFSANKVVGVKAADGREYLSQCVVVTTGTFLNGLIHCGEDRISAGRVDEPPSKQLSLCLADQKLTMGRLKTGTPARLNKHTIDWSLTEEQWGDDPMPKFSFWDTEILQPQLPCHITYTTPETHEVIRQNIHRSAMYSGAIKGVGPRYCPSIEDKLVKFADKVRHQVFLEPMGLELDMIYPNGLSTSLPAEVQLQFLRAIPCLREVEMIRPGYAIEYDFVMPNQLTPSLELKDLPNLFLAGQINGTSGYEEAAGQGLMAGINAALKVQGREPFTLRRNEAYIGVMIDDLITKGTNEPYRMFTSRAEYRLLLREDNADQRLSAKGYELGLLPETCYLQVKEKIRGLNSLTLLMEQTRVVPSQLNNTELETHGEALLKNACNALDLLKRPQVGMAQLEQFNFLNELPLHEFPHEVKEQVEINTKYAGYIQRQQLEMKSFEDLERIVLPLDMPYEGMPGLSREVIQKLSEYRPVNLGQASRISGITPAAISVLQIFLRNRSQRAKAS